MGWVNGSQVAITMIRAINEYDLEPDKVKFYKYVIRILTELDWDCEYEMFGVDPDLDEAFKKLGYDLDEQA